MHEYALTRQMVDIINGAAAAHGARKVSAAWLAVGENTCVIPESLQMYFDIAARGSAAAGAVLHIRVIEAEMRCPACGRNFRRPRFSFACPGCGVLGSPTDVGSECCVERVELELEDESELR